MLQVKLPDGSVKDYSKPTRVLDVANDIGPRLAKATLAGVVDGKVVGVDTELPNTGEVSLRLLTKKDAEALAVMRHSCAHIMARAVMRLFDGVQLAFGPTTGDGFYYDFAMPHKLSEEDFPKIEAEMARIIKADEGFERIVEPRERALGVVTDLGQEFKIEHISTGLADHPTLSFYRQGEFIDLCRGPHIPSPGAIGAFKLMSVAGAYWKGDANSKQLQRLYGTAWFSKEDLDAYLQKMEEAKKRDHRVLGKQLDLFSINPLVGGGLILWHPRGATIRGELETFVKAELQKRGYDPVYTPNIGKVDLYKISGHYPYYADAQFPTIKMKDHPNSIADAKAGKHVEEDEYLLKPMNCPHHIMIYKSRPRSYRDLPVRLAEFGTVYRFEQSGELNGMTRVRGFCQDDAHLFCTEDQVADEFRGCIEMTQFILKTLGLDDYRVRLSFRDPTSDKYVGKAEVWDRAERELEEVCRSMDLPQMSIARGEAAFYGPKADFIVADCIGRDWQLGTVQLDYNLPSEQRFGLEYVGSDNQTHRPIMIHRAPLGSMERFIGVLIEHYAGAFPLWLAPEQVRILTVSEKFSEYGRQVEKQLREAGIRVTGDFRAEKIGSKVRDAQIRLVPYMLVVGGREMEEGTVSIRDRIDGDVGALPIAAAIEKLQEEIRTKRIRQKVKMSAAPAATASVAEANEY
ncbi:MAG: threonine--tRNA ligase [Planctomycetia bacterium]|nr:threonine--tRNA ligase [Planctomycetia bacterium]